MGTSGFFLSEGLGWMSWLVLLILGLGTYFYLKLRRPPGYPPGLPALPLLGSIPFMKYGGDQFHKEFDRLAQKYGSIFSLALGHTWVVVLNDYDSIRDALVGKAKEFSGRIDDPRFDDIHPYLPIKGIINGDYSPEFIKQRHNALVMMRNFGWGKKGIAEKMSEERDILLEILRDEGRKPYHPGLAINTSVMNIICSMLFGERFQHNDPKLAKIIKSLDDIIALSALGSEWDYVPLLPYFFPSAKKLFEQIISDFKVLYDFAGEAIKKRRNDDKVVTIEEPRDFIECYLKEIKEIEKGKARITQDWLHDICVDFFVAGSETTTTSLKWALIYMVHYPDIQKKIQKEIDDVIGAPTGRGMTSLSDREKLPYTDAAIMEIQRLSAIVPTALIHKTTEDVEFKGYKIPKDTQVRYNVYSVLHDPKYWEDANDFKPERFLNKEEKVMKDDRWIPFGMGRRMCLGEQLARQELFMFFTAIMHSFSVQVPDGADLPSLEPAVKGVILGPSRMEYIFEPRY